MEYKIGNVYSLRLSHPSFSWNNGLFICLKIDDSTIWGCKLDKQGQPEKFDGRYMSFCTGINNKDIHSTNLTYKLEEGFKHN